MGFGHSVYSVKDPRSDIIKEYSAKLSEDHKDKLLHDAAVVMEAYLKEKKGLFPNTDFFHAPAYHYLGCLLYTSPSPRDGLLSRMPSSA